MAAASLPQLNVTDFEPQIIWLLVIFAFFYAFIRARVVPYFSNELKSRSQRISDGYHEAKKLQLKAERLAEEYNEKLQAVHLRANDLVLEAKNKVKRRVEEEKNRLNSEMNAKINDYFKAIEVDAALVDDQITKNIDNFVDQARYKIFDMQISSAVNKRVVN